MNDKTILVAADGVTPLRKPTEKQIAQRVVVKGGAKTLWESATGSLTPSRLSQMLMAHATGDLTNFLTFAEEVEEQNLHYGSVLGTRKKAVEGLDFVITAASDSRDDKEIAEACRQLIRGDRFVELVTDLLDALGKGFSVVNQVWRTDMPGPATWQPVAWEWWDQRLFQLDKTDPKKLRLRDPDREDGRALPPYKFIIHQSKLKNGAPHRAALARFIAWMYLFENFSIKDWIGFIETYGQPVRLGKYRQGTSDEQIYTLVRALQNIGTDAAAAIPESMHMEFISAANSGSGDVFQNMAEFAQRLISKAVLGQTLTTDAGKVGSQALGKVHNEVRHDIKRSDAMRICATVSAYVIRPFVELNFGVRDAYPVLSAPVLDPETLKAKAGVIKEMVDLGLPVGQNWAYRQFGIPEPKDGEPLLGQKKETETGGQAMARQLARAQLALARRGSPQAESLVDDIADGALDDWAEINAELVDPYVEAVNGADSYEGAIKALLSRFPDTDPARLARSLRAGQAAARGVGDATD